MLAPHGVSEVGGPAVPRAEFGRRTRSSVRERVRGCGVGWLASGRRVDAARCSRSLPPALPATRLPPSWGGRWRPGCLPAFPRSGYFVASGSAESVGKGRGLGGGGRGRERRTELCGRDESGEVRAQGKRGDGTRSGWKWRPAGPGLLRPLGLLPGLAGLRTAADADSLNETGAAGGTRSQ